MPTYSLNADQKNAVLCAYLDLCGALEAHNHGHSEWHDWKAVKQSLRELEKEFDFIATDKVQNLYEEDEEQEEELDNVDTQ